MNYVYTSKARIVENKGKYFIYTPFWNYWSGTGKEYNSLEAAIDELKLSITITTIIKFVPNYSSNEEWIIG